MIEVIIAGGEAGCAKCILRCHSFGGRVSLAAKTGVKKMIGKKGSRVGAKSGSCNRGE